MTTKRKVRKNFDSYREYSVDVSKCTEEEKKEVQQAFFDVGITWEGIGEVYVYTDATQYSNTVSEGKVLNHLMYCTKTDDCNMTPKEFLELIYEPKNQGHVHAENMALYAEDAKTHAEPWKLWECSTSKGELAVLSYHPSWGETFMYRRKPKTRSVHGVEIPVFDFSPKGGEYFYVVNVGLPEFFETSYRVSEECTYTQRMLERGLLYPYTEEGKQAAILHAKAMLGLQLARNRNR